MTTIVTRLFADAKTAEQAVNALLMQNHPEANISVVSAADGADAAMAAARVPEASVEKYMAAMTAGSALVAVSAPITPFGAARSAIATMDEFTAIDAGVENENYYIKEAPAEHLLMDLKVDRTHRYWASWGTERHHGLVSDAFSFPTVYSGTKFFGSFLAAPLTPVKHWGSFLANPLTPVKHWGSFLASPLTPIKYWGSFLVPPLAKRR